MKAKNKLLLLAMYVAVLIGFASIDSLAATITSAASGNWNAGATWVGGVVPSNTDDVIIASGHTVVVNLELTQANGNRSVQSLNVDGILRPDAGVRNIEIDNDLTVDDGGQINYNYLTTGRLNWTFTGVTDGSGTITNHANNAVTNLQFHNLEFAGSGVNATAAADGFTVYGDLDISSLSSFTMATFPITFNNTTAKTITNNNIVTFDDIILVTDAIVNYEGQSGSDNNITGNITIGTDATMTVVAPTVIDITGTSIIANSGDFNFNSGSELNITSNTSITTGDINNFNGDLTIGATTLTMGARSINGTGNLTTGASSVVSLANANGVKAALALSGTRTFNAGTSYVFSGAGDTGFDYTSGNDVTSVGNLTISGATTSADSFTITGTLSGAEAFTASAGTITSNGATIGAGGGAKTFNNLTVAGGATLAQNITVVGSLVNTSGTLAFSTFDVTMTGTGTLTLGTNTMGVGAQVIINGASANVTLGGAAALNGGGANGNITLTSGTLDMATYAITGTATPKLTLSAGTVRSSGANGILTNLAGYLLNQLSIAADINFEFYGTAVTNLGFNLGAAVTGGGAGTGISLIGDLTIEGTNAVISVGQAFAMAGDLTVEDGASLVADAIVTFNTTGSTITNNNSTSADLTFEDITINGAAAVAVTSATSFTINGSLLLDGTQADAFTMSAGTLTFTASGGNEEIDGITGATHTLTLNNLTLTSLNDLVVGTTQAFASGDFVINGNITVSGGGDLNFAAGNGNVSLAGFGKTITTTASNIDFDDVLISGTYTTASTFDVIGDGLVVTGQFSASAGTVTFTNAALSVTHIDVVDSLSFFNVVFGGTAANQTANFTVTNNFTNTAATFDFDGGGADGGDIKFTGNPSTIIATATAAETVFGDITVPTGARLLMTNANLVTLGETLTLTGTLEVNDDAQIIGTGLISSASGSELIYNDPAGTGGFAAAITANGAHVWNANMNLTVGAAAAAITDLGLDVPTTSIAAVGNLTLYHITSAIANLSGALTVNGNFTKASDDGTGTVALAAGAGLNDLTLAGTSKTFTNLDAAADLTLDVVIVSGSYSELATSNGFGIGLAAGSAGSFTVNTASSWTSVLATSAVMNINSTTAAALVVTGTGTALFNNFNIGANSTSNAIAASYTVQGNYTLTALGNFDHVATSTVTLSGTTKNLTNSVATTRGALTFYNLNVTGSYTSAGASGFTIAAAGTLTVSSTGTLSAHSATGGAIADVGVGFAGAGTIAGTGSKTFGVLATTAATTVTTAVDFTINGGVEDAFNNAGTFTATAGTVTLDNATGAATNSHLATAGTYTFNDLAVTGTGVINDVTTLIINGDLTVSSGGSLVCSGGKIQFAVAGDDVITNDGTLTFYQLDIDDVVGNNITTASSFNISENLTMSSSVDNSFRATAGTITFNGGSQTIDNWSTNSTGMVFYNLTKSGTNSLIFNYDLPVYIKGDITATGTGDIDFTAMFNVGKLYLNGTAEQNIIIGTTGVTQIDFSNVTLNNEFGLKLSGATTEGDIQVNYTLRLQDGDLDLNGNNILEIDESDGLLSETTGNTIINTATVASVGYVFVNKTPGLALTNNNMNGLGATITTTIDPGVIEVRRYHISRTVGSVDGISRVFGIESSITTGLDAKAVFKYDDSELNGLTAADLKMARSSNQITGPYYLESSTINTTNKIITVDNIDGFASGSVYEYWTASVPVIVTTAEITKGLASGDSLVAGRTAQGIYGLQFTANGDVTVNSITFGLDRDVTLANEFSKYYLVKSGDNDLSTTSDNTTLISGTSGSPATFTLSSTGITFNLSAASQLLTSASNLNYFLVVDVATSVTASTAAIGATFNETNLNITDGIIEAVSEAGTDYSFKPGLMIDELSNGLTQSPLIASTTSNGLIGFQIKSTTAATDGFDALVVGTNVDVTNIFDEVRLVRSTTNDLTSGTLTTVKTGVISSTGITFTNMNEATTVAAKYYFLVGDVNANVSKNTSSVIFTIADADLNDDVNAGPRYINALGNVSSSFSSASYSFDNSEVTVSQTTPLISQSPYNLGRGVNNQPVYRFTLASDNGNSVAFTKVIAQATLAKGLLAANVTSWKLWSDANGNDYPDTGEQIATGVYNANVAQGNLTFANFTSAQTTTSSKKYIVTVNLATGSTLNGELSVSLLSQSYVTVSSPARVNNFASLTGDTYTVKAPGTATTAKIVGLSTNSVNSGGSVSFTVRTFDANNVPANLTSSSAVALNVNAGGFTFGGTTTGTILAGSNFVSITPTMSHATGTALATATATVTGLPNTIASPTITVFKSAPTANGTVTLGTATSTTLSISSWTNGTGGTGRLVVISANTPPTAPTNGVTYTSNTNIGSGLTTAQTGAGSFVVATGNSAVTTVTGLTPGVTYYVQVFEYDGSGSTIVYNRTGKTSVSVDGATGNPAFKATTAGTTGASTLLTAANISTDVDVTGTITTDTEATDGKWFKFKVNANRNNFYIKLSDLPANYSLYLYDYTTGNEVLFRTSEALLLENDVVIVNNAAAGNYLIKIFGADNEEFDAATFGLKVVTSANEILSLTE